MQAITHSIRIGNNVNIIVRESEVVGPSLMVTGIWKGCADQKIAETMYLENPEIGNAFAERFITETKISCR